MYPLSRTVHDSFTQLFCGNRTVVKPLNFFSSHLTLVEKDFQRKSTLCLFHFLGVHLIRFLKKIRIKRFIVSVELDLWVILNIFTSHLCLN